MTARPTLVICVGLLISGAGQTTVVLREADYLAQYCSVRIVAGDVDLSEPVPHSVVNLRGLDRAERRRTITSIMASADVVHCHDSLELMWHAVRGASPVVITAHGILPIHLRRGPGVLARGIVTYIMYRRLYRRAAVLVGISPYICEWLRRYCGCDAVLIPHGSDQPVGRGAPELVDGKRRLLYIGEVSYRKGIDDLIRLGSLLNETFIIDIVGSGRVDRFKRAAIRAGVASRVHFWGHVDNETRDMLLGGAFVTISASRWEGYGLPIMEGFAHGVPAIVRNVGHLQDMIKLSKAGLAFRDIAEVPELIEAVGNDWLAYSQMATQFAAANPWYEKMDQYARVIHDVLDTRTRG